MANANVAIQTSYSERMKAGFAGQPASSRNWDALTRVCKTAAGIQYGLAVGLGAADGEAVLGGVLAKFLGVSLRDVTNVPTSGAVDIYREDENMGVLTQGDIFAVVGEAVAADDPVYYNSTTGVFYGSAGAGRVGPVVGARFMKASTSDNLAVLFLGGNRQAAA